MSTLLRGAPVAERLTLDLSRRSAALRQRGVIPPLAILRVGSSPGDLAYEKSAAARCARCGIEVRRLFWDSAAPLTDAIRAVNADPSIHGCLLLRPLADRAAEAAAGQLLLPDKESDFTTRTQLLDFVAMALGGYAAEMLVMGQMSTGASSDLQRATDICRRMVTQYGMSDDMGPIYLGGDHDEVFLARDYGQQSRTYSEDVAARIDAEVQRKMNDALARATAILKAHRAQLDGLSDLLVEKETIDRAEFVAFLKGEPSPEKKEENVLREPEQV